MAEEDLEAGDDNYLWKGSGEDDVYVQPRDIDHECRNKPELNSDREKEDSKG